MTLRPGKVNSGLLFRRVDVLGDRDIELRPDAVIDTRLGTTIANASGVRVATVEHVLAALGGMGVDNAVIDIDGPETPAMDGSSEPFVRMIEEAGLDTLNAPRRVLKVLKRVDVTLGQRRARFEPCERLELDVAIDYSGTSIGRQRAVFAPDPDTFAEEVAPARTFAFLNDVEALRAAGLARGGSMANCVVLDDVGVVNADGLRFDNEFARHKLLDALGDLMMAGAPIVGRYVADKTGHEVNNAALRALMADTSAWALVEERAPVRLHLVAEDGAVLRAAAQ